MKFGRLKQTHPRLNLGRVRMLHALYRGGGNLLGDDAVMDVVFGKIGDESDVIYGERKRRAFYENLFAMVINQISAGLAQDPARLAQNKDGKSEPPKAKPEIVDGEEQDDYEEDPADMPPVVAPEPEIDEYWTELMKNATVTSEDGGQERSFDQVMRDICVEAMVCGWAWYQVDLPEPTVPLDDGASLGDQDNAGDLRAYIATWPTDAITDWEEINGRVLWLRTYECINQSLDPEVPRFTGGMDPKGSRTHRWTIWTSDGWTRYDIVEDRDNPLTKWQDEMEVPVTKEGAHTFGRVPWIRFDLCTPGTYLHVGDLIESLCRVYFNRTNGESWQWTQNCFQQLYEFLAPEIAGIDTEISQAQQDPSRARRQRRSPGVVHERGHEDRAEYVAPDMSGAQVGKEATQDLRDAILRVTAQMALAQDTSGAMLRRSADSKKQDTVAQEIVMGAIGKRLLIAATQTTKLLAVVRGDTVDDAPLIEGYSRFDVDDATTLINDTVLLDAVEIPSATYQVEQKFRVAAAHLGDNVDPEILKKIRGELESAITQDQIENPPVPDNPFADEGDPTDDEGGGGPPKKPPFFGKGKGSQRAAPGHQEKPWSCGPAALVYVASALGVEVEEKTVRNHSDADEDGTDEKQLIGAAKKIGLRPMLLQYEEIDEAWNELRTSVKGGRPCVLCVDQWDHWVAVIGVSGDRIVMQDPANTRDNVEANGLHVLTKTELMRRWMHKTAEEPLYLIEFAKR